MPHVPVLVIGNPSISELIRATGGHVTTFRAADMEAAEKMLQLHQAKLTKAVEAKHWSDCGAALRAIEEEARHAQKIAGELAVQKEISGRFAEQLSARVKRSVRQL